MNIKKYSLGLVNVLEDFKYADRGWKLCMQKSILQKLA